MRGVELRPTILEAVTGADAAVIVTEWEELRGLASPEVRDAMRTPLIVDGRNVLDPETARAAGFTYESIGRAASDLRRARRDGGSPSRAGLTVFVEAIILAGGKAERLGRGGRRAAEGARRARRPAAGRLPGRARWPRRASTA